jgi:hypothetical protein
MLAFGLHITKCAGTSLMSDIRRRLSEDRYFICSSFYENVLACRPNFWDISDLSQLELVFGHYVHEDMLTTLRVDEGQQQFLFTGLRDPVQRAISHFKHLQRISETPVDVAMFAAEHGATICDEILRAFPSLVERNLSKAENALGILTCFDYIYSTESYAETIRKVYDVLGLKIAEEEQLISDNVNPRKIDDAELLVLQAAMESSEDVKLYHNISQFIGRDNVGSLISLELNIPSKRPDLIRHTRQRSPADALHSVFQRHTDLFGYELHLLGAEKKAMALALLNRRQQYAARAARFLAHRQY